MRYAVFLPSTRPATNAWSSARSLNSRCSQTKRAAGYRRLDLNWSGSRLPTPGPTASAAGAATSAKHQKKSDLASLRAECPKPLSCFAPASSAYSLSFFLLASSTFPSAPLSRRLPTSALSCSLLRSDLRPSFSPHCRFFDFPLWVP